MQLSESYKSRLQELAGIIVEVSNEDRVKAFEKSDQRVPYSKDLMITAIKEGREVGILFRTNNDKMQMAVSKYRIIFPTTIGTSKAGNEVIRAVHKIGQSESAARKTGVRSQEVVDEWRMFKVSNIKSMWMTGRFFSIPPRHYNAADKGMITIEISANFPEIKKFQKDLIAQSQNNGRPKPNIVPLFKPVEIEPVQEPIAPEPIEPEVIKPYVPKKTLKTTNPNIPVTPNPAVNPKKKFNDIV